MERLILYDYAMRLVGIPYRWGGTNPMMGYDCSGLVRALLRAQGIKVNPPGNAAGLYEQFKQFETEVIQLGSMIFYQDPILHHVDHVAMALDSEYQIEAAGGDHTTLTLNDAIAKNAFVRVSKIRIANRKAILHPAYRALAMDLPLSDSL